MPPLSPDAELPPPSTPEAASLARLIGRAATLALVEAYGGTRVYVPHTINQAAPLARAIGLDAARRLAEQYGRIELSVPQAKAWRAVIYRRRDGLTHAAIARKLGASESTVYAWLREGRPAGSDQAGADAEPTQLDLFGG